MGGEGLITYIVSWISGWGEALESYEVKVNLVTGRSKGTCCEGKGLSNSAAPLSCPIGKTCYLNGTGNYGGDADVCKGQASTFEVSL